MRCRQSLTRTLVAVSVLVFGSAAEAANVVIQPSSQDAYVQQDKPNRIAGAGPSHTRIRVQASPPATQVRRGLVQFDLSSIPTGSAINSAILELYEGNNPSQAITHGVHRADAPWLQSTVKWNNQPVHEAVPTATTVVPADTVREFRSFDVTTDVQSFISLCSTNHGWVVRDQSETASNQDENYIAREENQIPDIPHRPRLTVDFTPPGCAIDGDCGDGNPCTTNEHCVAGACVVDPVDCDDSDPCTDDICDCTIGCINAPICNDGFACTLDTCNPATLACSNVAMNSVCDTTCATGTCVADPDRDDIDQDTGCFNTSVSPAGTPCSDGDGCTQGETCNGLGQCTGAEPIVCDHYVAYKATAAKLTALPDLDKFPADFNVSLDDTLFDNAPPDLYPDDPENYVVKKERGIANPAMKDDEPGPMNPNRHYLRYQIKTAKEGIGPEDPPASGAFPKAVKSPKRQWHVTNQFGDVFVLTKKAAALWVPTGKAEAPAMPSPPADATHYKCYKAKVAKIPSAQAPDVKGNGKGVFRKDLQHYFADQFDDCHFLPDGVSVPFDGTPVAGKCLFDLKKVKEICDPVDKTAVVPPRLTSATITGSIATVRTQALLCYQAKLATKIRSTDAGALGGLPVGAAIKQSKHVPRRLKDGTQVNTFPGNQFPRPLGLDTKKVELVCVPSDVLSIGAP
jgi:hypothetical protein